MGMEGKKSRQQKEETGNEGNLKGSLRRHCLGEDDGLWRYRARNGDITGL